MSLFLQIGIREPVFNQESNTHQFKRCYRVVVLVVSHSSSLDLPLSSCVSCPAYFLNCKVITAYLVAFTGCVQT